MSNKSNYLLRSLAGHIANCTNQSFDGTVIMLQNFFGPNCVRVTAEEEGVGRAALTPYQLAEFILNEMKGWERVVVGPSAYTPEGLTRLLQAIHMGETVLIQSSESVEPKGTITPVDPMAQQVGGSHYKGDKIQHFTLCMEDNIPWGEASAIKYLMRHRKKNGLQDLLKALHYVEMTIEHYHPGALSEHRAGPSK